MTRVQGGDRRALEVLLRRHHDRLFGLCRRLTGNDADAADACQDAMIAVVRGLDRFDGRAAFSTWAYRVTTNACLDELRRRGRRAIPGLPEDGAERASVGAAAVAALDSGASDIAESTSIRMDTETALARLPHDFRVAVVLRDQCRLAYDEIAETLDVPIGTVRSRIARGRAALADAMGLTYAAEAAHGEPTGSPASSKPTPRPASIADGEKT